MAVQSTKLNMREENTMNEITNATVKAPASFTFKNKKLNEISLKIAKIGDDMGKKNMELAKLLGAVKKDELFKEDGFKSVAEYADSTFGIQKSLAYQLAKVGERFYLSDSATAKTVSAMLPPSNLAELVNMKDEEIQKALDEKEITPATTQKTLRSVASGVKHTKPKTLEDYTVDAEIIHFGTVDRIHWDKTQLPVALDEIPQRISISAYDIEKQFIREGKYEGAYHKGVKVILCEEGELVRLTYGIVSKPKKDEPKKPKFTRAQLLKMLAEMPEDEGE